MLFFLYGFVLSSRFLLPRPEFSSELSSSDDIINKALLPPNTVSDLLLQSSSNEQLRGAFSEVEEWFPSKSIVASLFEETSDRARSFFMLSLSCWFLNLAGINTRFES